MSQRDFQTRAGGKVLLRLVRVEARMNESRLLRLGDEMAFVLEKYRESWKGQHISGVTCTGECLVCQAERSVRRWLQATTREELNA